MNAAKLSNNHDDLTLASAIELTQKDPLPPSQQQVSIVKRNCHRRSCQTRFNVCVGILLAMTKAHTVLRNQGAECVQHVPRHIRIGVLVDGEARGGVLHVQHNHTFASA